MEKSCNTNLEMEIASLKERIKAIEKGIELAHVDQERVPTEIQKQVGALKELHEKEFKYLREKLEDKIDEVNKLKEEKFLKVDQRFDLIEKQRVEQKQDTRETFNSAITAVQKLFELQNTSFTKQVDQQQSEFRTSNQALNEKIDDNKERLTRIEGIDAGALNNKVQQQSTGGYNAVIIGLIISTIIGIVAIIVSIMK